MNASMPMSGILCVVASLAMVAMAAQRGERNATESSRAEEPIGTLVFSGGYETDPGGRPVTLIAGALGVPDEVFREAFRGVRPARGGRPTPDQVRKNKAVLLGALAKYGVTNERLDAVSDHYRYRPERGERWPTTPAKGYAKIENGKITGFVITYGGSGYNSPPSVSIVGMPGATARVKLTFSKDFKKNGAVADVTLLHADTNRLNRPTSK